MTRRTTREEKIARPGVYEVDDDTMYTEDQMISAVASEREACARMCEEMGIEDYGTLAIAAAIRARGDKRLAQPEQEQWVKTYTGGKPNYTTPIA